MIQHLADRVAVMYLGRIVEIANRKELFQTPAHPYTQALLRRFPLETQDSTPLADRVLAGMFPVLPSSILAAFLPNVVHK